MEKQSDAESVITSQIDVPAPLTEVWRAWTTEEGVESFFAPECNIDLRPGGHTKCSLILMLGMGIGAEKA